MVALEDLAVETPSYIPHVPFHAYLKEPTLPKHAASDLRPFHQFPRLPPELQLMVLEACDAPTLFNLMHTCSSIRARAKTLFWSHKDPWYHASERWILGKEAVSEGCPDFNNNVEQVELQLKCGDYISLHHKKHVSTNGGGSGVYPSALNEEAAKVFWQKFQHVFPSAKRVVINAWTRESPSSFRDEFLALFRAHPSSMTVLMCNRMLKDKSPRSKDALHQLTAGSKWVVLQHPWTRCSVSPARSQVTSIVGRFHRFTWKKRDFWAREYALIHLRNQVYENYHFGGGRHTSFECPYPDCQKEIKQAGQFEEHVLTERDNLGEAHDRAKYGLLVKHPGLPSPLPTTIEKALLALELDWQRGNEKLTQQLNLLREEWGYPNSERRRLYDKRFNAQLRNDSLYNKGDAASLYDTMQSFRRTPWF